MVKGSEVEGVKGHWVEVPGKTKASCDLFGRHLHEFVLDIAPTANAVLATLLVDCAGLDRVSDVVPLSSIEDDVQLKILSILEGRFEAPGFSNSPQFRNALRRQQILSKISPGKDILYESAWDSVSPGRLKRVYTRHVLDWDELSGTTFHIRWWSQGLQHYAKWDRGLTFWTYEELQEAHREHLAGTAGPQFRDWCHVEGYLDWSMFWSAALLFKYAGSSGVKYWDTQFHELKQRFLL